MHGLALRGFAIGTPGLRTLWVLGVVATWWLVIWSRMSGIAATETLDRPLHLALPIVLTALRAMGFAMETFFYAAWWRGSGCAFSFGSALPWFATLSLFDAWASTLRALAADLSEPWVSAIAVLVGASVHASSMSHTPGLAAALGDTGLLTLGRLAGAVWIQMRETGRPPLGPMTLTLAAWLTFRLISWWSYDLMRGASPS